MVSADDQALVATTIGIKEEDAVYLGNLTTGVALCHKEGMSLPVYVDINSIEDNFISDSDLVGKDILEIFEPINRQLIVENLSMKLECLSLKLLNSVMALNGETVSKIILNCKESIVAELEKRDISLLPCRNLKSLLGKILADGVLLLLNNGVYSSSNLVSDELCAALINLCETGLDTYLLEVQNLMKKNYNRTSRNHCILVISELLKRQYSPKVDVVHSIEQYFFEVPSDLIQEISAKVRGCV